MKKYQYAVMIVLAVLFGAFMALWVGNTLTGVLSGVLMALAVSGIGSLQWERKAVACVARKAQAVAQFDYALFFGRIGRFIASGVLWFVKWFFKILYVLTLGWIVTIVQLFAQPFYRKMGYYSLFAGISVIAMWLLSVPLQDTISELWATSWATIGAIAPVVTFGLIVVTGMLGICSLLLCILVVSFWIVVFGICIEKVLAGEFGEWGETNFYYGNYCVVRLVFYWWDLGEVDERPPLRSFLYMLKVRTLNALKFYVWAFLMIFYLPAKLFTFKTGAAMITAVVLSGIHLGVSYTFGWIATGNMNFWLLCAVSMAFGAVAGMKIHALKKFEVKVPTITWLEHQPMPAENGA